MTAEGSGSIPRGPAELAVIGAGPAGLAAALTAADLGVRVVLLDSEPAAGGQYFRQPASRPYARPPRTPFHTRLTWRRLRSRLDAHLAAGRISHLMNHDVWFAQREDGRFTVHALVRPWPEEARSVAVTADALLLATGGYEKVLPFPGCTLPGVTAAGGLKAMLKNGLSLSGSVAVVAGTGPLLLPVATGLATAGVRVAALVEAAAPSALVRQAPRLARDPLKLLEGAQHAARLLRHRVPVHMGHTIVGAHGTDRLEAVTVAALDEQGRVRAGTERRIACNTLAVGHGMVPHLDLAVALGARLDTASRSDTTPRSNAAPGSNTATDLDTAAGPAVAVDDEQRTDVPGLWAAGEATGIGGAALALAEGEIAGRSIAARLRGAKPDPRGWAAAARARARQRSFFAALDAVCAPPAGWAEEVADDTVVCRCEEVPASAVREAVRESGAGDLRTVKLLTRAGMGWCQGRICGPAVAGISGCPLDAVRRPFARPVPLGVLAGGSPAPLEARP